LLGITANEQGLAAVREIVFRLPGNRCPFLF